MSTEHAITLVDRIGIEMDVFSSSSTAPTITPPSGNGWRLTNTLLGDYKIYLFWQRGDGVVTITTDHTVANGEEIILVDANAADVDLTLPSSTANFRITVKKIDSSSNVVNILPPYGKTIDGDNSFIISVSMNAIELVTDGNNWFVV